MNKKILWISMCAPYAGVPHAGGKTLEYYIRNLAAQGWDITLIAKLRAGEENKLDQIGKGVRLIPVVNRTGTARLLDLAISAPGKCNPFSPYGNTLLQSVYNAIEKQLRQLKGEGYAPDVIITEWGQITLFVKKIKKHFPQAKIVASEHDVMFLGNRREADYARGAKKLWEKLRADNIYRREMAALAQCDLVVTHNAKDKKLLVDNGMSPEKIHEIVPYYGKTELVRCPNGRDIIFYGDMRRKENYLSAHWFIDRVMPLLQEQDIRFVIIGGSPDQSLLARVSDRVVVTGFVEDLTAYFASCCCMAAPLVLGAGIKIKILEAMAAGIPVLTNEIGIEGIPAENGRDYIHCEKPEEYAQAILKIIRDDVDIAQMSLRAKQRIAQAFPMEQSLKTYSRRLASLCMHDI